MNEEIRKGAFIPCGDSLERMQEIDEAALEDISGGISGDAFSGAFEAIEDDLLGNEPC